MRIEDGSNIIRIISPDEEVPLASIKEAIEKFCIVKSEIYPEKFSANVVLFGRLSNGNFRIKEEFKSPEKEQVKEIMVYGRRIKIAVMGQHGGAICAIA